MARIVRSRGTELRQGFLVQLGLFSFVNGAFVLNTVRVDGGFWWLPVTMIWGGVVAAYGGLAYWVNRRERWDTETDEQHMRLVAPPHPLK